MHLCVPNYSNVCFTLLYFSCTDNLSGAKSNHLFPLIHPDRMRDPRNNSQFRLKIPVQLRVIWFFCSPEIYMYSAYQLDYWQVGRITQFEVTCFSVCSIQCHIALDEQDYCFVEQIWNFLVCPFSEQAACSSQFVFIQKSVHWLSHYPTTYKNTTLNESFLNDALFVFLISLWWKNKLERSQDQGANRVDFSVDENRAARRRPTLPFESY